MRYYVEITLLPGVDVGLYFLWEKLYQRIHQVFVEIQNSKGEVPIGVSFPEYSLSPPQLGNKLRLFALEENIIQKLDIKSKLQVFNEYIHVTGIRPVPASTNRYCINRRYQPKTGKERLARRKAKRSALSFTEALEAVKGFQDNKSNLPYIFIKSLSTGKRFPLFIDKSESTKTDSFVFNTYGLGTTSSVPEF